MAADASKAVVSPVVSSGEVEDDPDDPDIPPSHQYPTKKTKTCRRTLYDGSPYTTPGRQSAAERNCASLYSRKQKILDQQYLEAEYHTQLAKIRLEAAELEYKIALEYKLPEAALNYEVAKKRARDYGVDPNVIKY